RPGEARNGGEKGVWQKRSSSRRQVSWMVSSWIVESHLLRGSSESRSPSPSRFRLRTATKIAAPAESEYQGVWVRYLRPVSSMEPQDGVGGWTPSPRNESAASVRVAFANATDGCPSGGDEPDRHEPRRL